MLRFAGWLLSSVGWLLVWVFGLVGLYVLLGSTHYTNGAVGPILNILAIPVGVGLIFLGRAMRGRGMLWLALRRRARRKQGLDW
ncbi:MAG: hypothetical protein E6G44_04880 [Actinobacteria bacterium]|nr:MAG: hypothetical protein E6G44_04880 [Actinomycetota bacterium]